MESKTGACTPVSALKKFAVNLCVPKGKKIKLKISLFVFHCGQKFLYMQFKQFLALSQLKARKNSLIAM